MPFSHSLKQFGSSFLKLTKYTEPVRDLVNTLPVDTTITTGSNVEISRLCELSGNIRLDDDVRIGSKSRLDGDISIGKGTNIVHEGELIGTVDIGRYCAIARDVTFQGRNHVVNKPGIQMRHYRELGLTLGERSEPILVGHDVWIGTRVIVLPGVEIGNGAVIGAGSIVTKDVEPYSVAAGVPAEHKKWRFSEEKREELQEIEWWNWSEEKRRRNREFFDTKIDATDNLREQIR